MHRNHLFISLFGVAILAASAHAQPISQYAGQEQRPIKALSEDDIGDLLEARGMGLAKAAELNSYPGPLHVTQLADQLALSAAQRTATEALYAQMRERAQSLGRKIIDAERELDQAFADRKIDPATLRTQVESVATLQGELRITHLQTHLAQSALLTPEQIKRYDVLRGYGSGGMQHGSPQHGGG